MKMNTFVYNGMGMIWGNGYATVEGRVVGYLHHEPTGKTEKIGKVQLDGSGIIHYQQKGKGFFHGAVEKMTDESVIFRSELFPSFTLAITRKAYDALRKQFS